MKKALLFLGFILLTLLIGGLSGLLSAGEVNTWYMTLRKPAFNPPNWVFGPVWTTLPPHGGFVIYDTADK